MYRALGYFGRAAIYYVRIHNEYSLTTRDQGFNYDVNSAGCAIAEPTEIYQKFARFAPPSFFMCGTLRNKRRRHAADYGVNNAMT